MAEPELTAIVLFRIVILVVRTMLLEMMAMVVWVNI